MLPLHQFVTGINHKSKHRLIAKSSSPKSDLWPRPPPPTLTYSRLVDPLGAVILMFKKLVKRGSFWVRIFSANSVTLLLKVLAQELQYKKNCILLLLVFFLTYEGLFFLFFWLLIFTFFRQIIWRSVIFAMFVNG